jgi:hypothetical protein
VSLLGTVYLLCTYIPSQLMNQISISVVYPRHTGEARTYQQRDGMKISNTTTATIVQRGRPAIRRMN